MAKIKLDNRTNKINLTFRLSKDLVDTLRKIENYNSFVENTLRNELKRLNITID